MTTKSQTIDPLAMAQGAERACEMLKVLANTDRLLILCQLSQGDKSVSEIALATNIMQPTLSQQLGVLRNAEVVTTRRDGKYIYYSIANPFSLAMMSLLYAEFCKK
jgi:DNA-binding transcriptional ArsR family regulator